MTCWLAERGTATWGGTYVPLRNQLSKEVANKLIFVKSNMAFHKGSSMKLADYELCLVALHSLDLLLHE